MSYILDALRKADAQRARDPVRGIHAQPLRGSESSGNAQARLRPLHIAVALAGFIVLAAAGWFVFRGGDDKKFDSGESAAAVPAHMRPRPGLAASPGAPMESPAAMPPQAKVQSLPPVQSLEAAPVVGNAIQPPPSASPPPTVGQLAAAMPPRWPAAGEDPRAPRIPRSGPRVGSAMEALPAEPQPNAPPVAPAAIAQTPGALPSINVSGTEMNIPAAPQMSPATPMPGARAGTAAIAAATTPPASGLPADAPKLAINGGVYSTNKAQRMLIVNGQVYNEGNEIAAGVVLDEIKNKTAVLRYRGSRYTVAY
ncbi:general secretion pathway protein GspB [Caenimonas sp. SL110]|uniref:general secretion pathway protein GspB n=1 Tax=Caenimonas sp. SL110 TaxID=1450524 RepID=UPI000652C9F5|nr:general secretion pathway protein GspB [Caenimonas sp. SL110]